MKAKHNQDQLQLDFKEAQDALKVAVDRFGEAAANLIEASTDNPEAKPEMDEEMTAIRRQINRMIGVLAAQTGKDYHTLWVLAYHEHYARTGFHAVTESKGKGTHLDVVAREGQLPALANTVAGMLMKPEFAHKAP